jgi:FkbM family methyltransferase
MHPAPVVSTRRLFARLLRTLDVTTVCDVGSMDGTDAEFFRRQLPDANILALEPSPRNYALMRQDERLRAHRIRVLPFAASDQESDAPFFVVQAEYEEGKNRYPRGMSSLHRRSDDSVLAEVVSVRTVRLDRLLIDERLADGALAFWIDTEGMAYEVIKGAHGVLANARLLHVEVETTPCIGSNQRLFPDVLRCLEEAGFDLLATDQPRNYRQFNALFVRCDLLRNCAAPIRAWLALAWLWRGAASGLQRFVPPAVRRRLGLHIIPPRVRRRIALWLQ